MTDLSELEARLRRHDDERLVLRRLYAYAHSMDDRDRERWLDCFTPDGVFRASSSEPGAPEFRVAGREELASFIVQHGRRPEGMAIQHLVLHPLIDVDGDEATARSYLVVLGGMRGQATMIRMFGRYTDRLVRCPDGEWRFAERAAFTEAVHAEAPRLVLAAGPGN